MLNTHLISSFITAAYSQEFIREDIPERTKEEEENILMLCSGYFEKPCAAKTANKKNKQQIESQYI